VWLHRPAQKGLVDRVLEDAADAWLVVAMLFYHRMKSFAMGVCRSYADAPLFYALEKVPFVEHDKLQCGVLVNVIENFCAWASTRPRAGDRRNFQYDFLPEGDPRRTEEGCDDGASVEWAVFHDTFWEDVVGYAQRSGAKQVQRTEILSFMQQPFSKRGVVPANNLVEGRNGYFFNLRRREYTEQELVIREAFVEEP